MDSAANPLSNLPDDIEVLKRLVQEQAARHEQERARYQAQIASLQEQLNLLLHKRYGASSEKYSPDQLELFNEAEAQVDEGPADEEDLVSVPAHQRKKRGRKPLPESLPRVRIEHDLEGAEKICPCGCQLTRIGEQISEQLDIVPAQIRVIQHVRPTYACKACEETVTTAPLPPQPIPKSNASPGLLAHIAVSKYQDALPLYRQERILQRIGVDIPRATLANWMIAVGMLVQPLINLLRDKLIGYDILGMDETPIQVLKEPDRPATSKSYIWVQRGGPPHQTVVLFHYDPSRGQAVAKELLAGYQGFVHVDGFEAYETVASQQSEITLVGCWAHARRKFDEALKAQGKKTHAKAGKAMMGMNYIRKLYRIEKALKDHSPEQRHRAREQQARAIVKQLRDWLDKSLPEVPPGTLTGKALHYLHNQWHKLVRYLEDGRLRMDNNLIENAIRPFVLGRKNWLFSDTPKGATASANLYSLIETAKANGLEPYYYLRYVFTELPKAQTVEQIEALLPFNLDADKIRKSIDLR
jgi:transposase